jgi:hypothetical protein
MHLLNSSRLRLSTQLQRASSRSGVLHVVLVATMLEGKYRCENKDLFVVGFVLAATTGVCCCLLVPSSLLERWRGDLLGE